MKQRLSLLALAVALTTALSACAPLPVKPGAALSLPDQFAAQPAVGQGTPLMAQAFTPHEPLQALVDEVLANNRDLRAAAARWQQSRALAEAAGAARLPSADLNASASRTRLPDGSGGSSTSNAYSLNTTARWELDLWGRASSAAQAASAQASAAQGDQDAARLSLAAEALRLQLELIGLGQRLQLAQETLTVQRQVLDLVKARTAAGRGTALDEARAVVLVSNTEASVPAIRQQACTTRLRLDVLRGQAPSPQADCSVSLPQAPQLPEPRLMDLGQLASPTALLQARPDVRAATARAQAAAAQAQVAFALRWPSIGLNGQIGWSASRAGDLLKSANLVSSLGAGLNWTWLDFGARKAEANAAQAGYSAALAQAEQAQLLALEDAQASLFTLREVELQTAAQSNAAQAATQARQLAAARYDAGVADFFSLLDAERERLAAQDRLIQLQVGRATALLAVHKAFAAGLTAAQASTN
jgi:NodT family efflux transporter outer membrane factor (OMF) lipoprotein